MSITQTKFRKGYVETPILKTDDIEYMGHELPLYDFTSKELVTKPEDFEKEIGQTKTSYQTSTCRYIRILPHSPAFVDDIMLTLTKLKLDFSQRNADEISEREFIVLYVYGYKDGNYIFLGSSQTVYVNPVVNASLDFYFDNISLFEDIGDNKILGYDQVFVRPHVVTLDENGVIVGGLDDTNWDSINHSSIKLKGCGNNNEMFNPYVTSDDQEFTPHIVFGYRKSVFTSDAKIPHNLNADVHITPSDKEKIEQLSKLGDLILIEEQKQTRVIDTQNTDGYNNSNPETIVSFTMKTRDFKDFKLNKLVLKSLPTSGNFSITNKWLIGDCFDVNGTLIKTFFSNESSSRQDTTTTWTFSDFEIKEDYETIEFRLATTKGEHPTSYANLLFKAASIRNSSGNRLAFQSGWQTKWSNGEDVNATNVTVHDFTPDLQMFFEPIIATGLEFIQHLTDKNQHITTEERNEIQEWLDVSKNTEIQLRIDVRDFVSDFDGFDKQSILGFGMIVEDEYKESQIKSITIRRSDDANLRGTELYLYGNCLDGDNVLIGNFYSINKKKQQASDNRITKWDFEDFIIPDGCKKIEFYLTSTKGDPQLDSTNNSFRIGTLKRGSVDFYKEGWQIRWPNANKDYKNYTADFVIDYTKKVSNIITHPNDTKVHLSSEDREKLESITENQGVIEDHIQDTSLHWQDSDRTDITNLKRHVSDDDVHFTSGQKETITNLPDQVNEHIADSLIHITQEEKEKLFANRYNLFKNYDWSIHEKDKAVVYGYDLSKLHFTSGKLDEIRVLTGVGDGYINGYLCVQIFFEGDTEETDKTNDTYFSINSVDTGRSAHAVYHFENLIIPNEYKFVRFSIVPESTIINGIIPNPATQTGVSGFKPLVLKKNNSVDFDDDECKAWAGVNIQRNWLIATEAIVVDKSIFPFNKISSNKWTIQCPLSALSSLQSVISSLQQSYDLTYNSTCHDSYSFDITNGTEGTTTSKMIIVEIKFSNSITYTEMVQFLILIIDGGGKVFPVF